MQEVQVQPSQAQEELEEVFWLESITCPDNSPAWEVQLPIGENSKNSTTKFKIDTGADISVLTRECYQQLQEKPPIRPTHVTLLSPGGKVRTAGECTINTNYRGQQYRFRAIVVQGTKNNLLSRAVAREMSLIQRVEELNVFGTCGLMRTDPVAIHIKEDAKP